MTGDTPSTEPDDSELVARAKGGGAAGRRAFGELVRRHLAWLVRLVAYFIGSHAEAEEVAQEVLLRAHAGLADFRGDASFRGWLRIIATRLSYNHTRSNTARRRREMDIGPMLAEPAPGPDLATRQALLLVLGRLPYPYREILLLRHVEEMSIREIAATLEIGESAAKMRLSRARAAFAECHEEVTR
jgi:RNA polymerase sigma-70 factor (ECF subfamily)